MCNCFKEICEQLKSTVTFKSRILVVMSPKTLPFTAILEGQKKDKTISVAINFCPICGEEYSESI